MNIPQSRKLLAHVQIASALLAAVGTSCNLRVEANTLLTESELSRLDLFWQQQLTNAIAELETARRMTETKRSK